jgi:hypothetical protein
MTVILARAAAWLSLLVIFVVTVGPIWLRPVSPMPAHMERFAAFLIVGSLFGAAYPKRLLMMMAIVIVSAALFELAQHLVPDRHGMFADFIVKAAGGGLGVLTAGTIARTLGFGSRWGCPTRVLRTERQTRGQLAKQAFLTLPAPRTPESVRVEKEANGPERRQG